jgi:hypothetical protein
MNWKHELDALIGSTMAFARDLTRQPIPDLPVALRTAEQTLPNPVDQPATIAQIVWPSERDEIRKRVDNFKAHQEKNRKGARGLLSASESQDAGPR